MDQDTKDWLHRIEGKLDTALASVAQHSTDISWIKGGLSIGLMVILSCAGYIVSKYFDTLSK